MKNREFPKLEKGVEFIDQDFSNQPLEFQERMKKLRKIYKHEYLNEPLVDDYEISITSLKKSKLSLYEKWIQLDDSSDLIETKQLFVTNFNKLD